MSEQMNLAIAGVGGRMGRQLVGAALDAGHTVTGGTELPVSQLLERDIGLIAARPEIGSTPTASVADAARGAQVWIDFTRPAATLAALRSLRDTGVKAAIIGTTGFEETDGAALEAAARHMAIVKAGNFSLGVNLLEALTQIAAARLGVEWDIEILETHHRRKVDAPSGTALMLGEAAAEGRGARLADVKAGPYDGPEAKRDVGAIGFSARRMGDVIGEHEVSFGSDQEIVTLRHAALDRSVFATGALAAAKWAIAQPPGLYDMHDVLGLPTTA